MSDPKTDMLDSLSKAAQVLTVVVGVVISVLSFNATRQKEAETRKLEAQKYFDQQQAQDRKMQVEAAKPFLDLRQKLYMEAIQNAAVLVNPATHEPEEIKKANKRFGELYWAELAMVESKSVDGAMKALRDELMNSQASEDARQQACLRLAYALRDSLVVSWGIVDTTSIDP